MSYELPDEIPDDIEIIEHNPRNVAGRAFGYSGCECCGDTWNWKEKHDTYYGPDGGVFPLCEECWQKLATPEKRLPYYQALLDNWREQCDCMGTGCNLCMEHADAIFAAVMMGK